MTTKCRLVRGSRIKILLEVTGIVRETIASIILIRPILPTRRIETGTVWKVTQPQNQTTTMMIFRCWGIWEMKHTWDVDCDIIMSHLGYDIFMFYFLFRLWLYDGLCTLWWITYFILWQTLWYYSDSICNIILLC